MPHLLTADQIEQIKKIIEKHHVAVIAQLVGEQVLTDDERKILEETDISLEDLESFKQTYLYGQAVAQASAPNIADMSYEEFQKWLQKNPIPLSEPEEFAIEAANYRAGEHIRNLGAKTALQAGVLVLQQDEQLRQQLLGEVRDATAENIRKRQGIGKLKSELGKLSGDWSRDWMRVSVTEKHQAMQQGVADSYAKRFGRETLVFKRPMPDACKHCKRLHLGPDGNPWIFKLSDLRANGTNVGRKAADWQAVVGSVHPWCQCQLSHVPKGWGFNEDGELVPGGKGGQETTTEAVKAFLTRQDSLQKAFSVRSRLDYRGLPIAIEQPVGSLRHWVDEDGIPGTTRMLCAYGYIEGTQGSRAEGTDEYDVFVGPNPDAEFVYVMHQMRKPDFLEWDEDKAMVGFSGPWEAKEAYLAHYDDPRFLGSMSQVPFEEFKEKVLRTRLGGSDQADGMVKALNQEYAAASSPMGNRNVRTSGGINFTMGFPPELLQRNQGNVSPGIQIPVEHWENDPAGPERDHKPTNRTKEAFIIYEEPVPVEPKPVEVPDLYIEALQAAIDDSANQKQVILEAYAQQYQTGLAPSGMNYARVEARKHGTEKPPVKHTIQKAILEKGTGPYKYISKKWMKDHWVYEYAKEHDGKVEPHGFDPDKVMVKVLKTKMDALTKLKKKYALAGKIITGGKYAMMELSQAEANKLRGVLDKQKPKVVQKKQPIQKQPAKKPKVPLDLSPVKREDLNIPRTPKMVKAGVKITGQTKKTKETISGEMIGTDGFGRIIVRQESGQTRVINPATMQLQKGQEHNGMKTSLDSVADKDIHKASPRMQKIVSQVMSEEVLPKHPVTEYTGYLTSRGHEAYLVGGVVRDLITGISGGKSDKDVLAAMKDVDIVSTAHSKIGGAMFETVGADIEPGISPVTGHPFKKGGVWGPWYGHGYLLGGGHKIGDSREEGLDFAAMSSGGSHGDWVTADPDTGDKTREGLHFDHDLLANAKGRDFTMNALFYDPENHTVIDPLGTGIEDARKGFLRVAQPGDEYMQNDALSFRFWKFRVRGYVSDKENIQKMRKHLEYRASVMKTEDFQKEFMKQCGKICGDPETYLKKLRTTMEQDGCGDLYDKYMQPAEQALIQKYGKKD